MIKIKGHSNFKVECILINNIYYILKSCKKEDIYRLEKQIKKQEILRKNNFLINCNVPEIYKKEELDNRIIFYMEYIKNSLNIIDFLSKENSIKIEWLYNSIISIINCYIDKCIMKNININI